MRKGKFITFEGIDGSGKSTQAKLLYETLRDRGIDVILTREIGGTPEAEKIRDIVVNSDILSMTELLLIMAARYEHIHKVILPALNKGQWVICDRFIDSTAIYQGYLSTDISVDMVYRLHDELISSLMPDLTIVLNATVKEAATRIISRCDSCNNKFEEKDSKYHEKAAVKFQKLEDIFPDRIYNISFKDRKTINNIIEYIVEDKFNI